MKPYVQPDLEILTAIAESVGAFDREANGRFLGLPVPPAKGDGATE